MRRLTAVGRRRVQEFYAHALEQHGPGADRDRALRQMIEQIEREALAVGVGAILEQSDGSGRLALGPELFESLRRD